MTASRILLVDDSPTVLHVLKQTLEVSNCEILTATNGQQALSTALEQQPDLILLDVILPGLNGYEVCRQIKSTAETANIPVVMITSKSNDADRHWGMEQGADDYVAKPFDPNTLLDVIARFAPKLREAV